MRIGQIYRKTPQAVKGMTVRQIFTICADYNVPALPFIDQYGDVTGQIRLSHLLRESYLPDFATDVAHLMGNQLDSAMLEPEKLKNALDHTIDDYVENNIPVLTTETSLFKAMAILEKYHVNYFFVTDEKEYAGIVTTVDIARKLLKVAG